MRRRRILAGSLFAVSLGLVAACGPDWDALDPSLGDGAGPGGGQTFCPPDGSDCTIDNCTSGIPKYEPVVAGTLCSTNGGAFCNANGQCVECNVPADCSGTDDDCRIRTCSPEGTCGFSFQPSGHVVPTQVAGDCKTRVCDGMGVVNDKIDDADKPVDNVECTADLCAAGEPMNQPLAGGALCSEGGGKVCNGAGACVQCNVPADCGADSACVKYTCNAGVCPSNPNLAAGEPCGISARCDGGGGCVTCQTPSALSFTTADAPVMVPNNNLTGVTSTVAVAGLGSSITDVNVSVSLTGDASGDLTLTLVSPKGTPIDLSSNNGGANDNNFAGTTFDDDSNGVRITEVTFVNNVTVLSAVPERNLGLLNGEDPNGTWMLVVKDTGNLGALNPLLMSWSLTITAQNGNFALSPPAFSNMNAVSVPDNAEASSIITVSDTPGFITKATVNVNLEHKSTSQLVLSLVSPSNKVIPLSTSNGTNDSFAGTSFDEAAANLVGCAGAGCVAFPAVGAVASAIPEGALSALVGDDPNGTWTLTIKDMVNGQTGTLKAWTLNLTTALCPLVP